MTRPTERITVRQMTVFQRIGWYTGPRTPTGCREWMGAVSRNGSYARLKFGGNDHRVARLLLGLGHGDLRVAMHACDNPRCVEQSHLRAGTSAENTADMILKGRRSTTSGLRRGQLTGANHPKAKLSETDVIAIRAARGAGAPTTSLATQYGITKTHVSAIVCRRAWKHIA